jgi:hypothetical protein
MLQYKPKTKQFIYEMLGKTTASVPEDKNKSLVAIYDMISSFKPEKETDFAKSDKWEKYLTCGVLCSPHVLDARKIKDTMLYKFDKINCLVGECTVQNLRDNSSTGTEAFLNIGYHTLLATVKNINVQRLDTLFKNIYKNRHGIINHYKLTPAVKEDAWRKALTGIMAIDLDNITCPLERTVLNCWRYILNSVYCFYIIMYGAPGSAHFTSAMNVLLSTKPTLQLLFTVLYPISFICTPFMCTTHKVSLGGKGKSSEYKLKIKSYFNEIAQSDSAEACGWIGYLNNTEKTENMNLGLLSSFITEYLGC